MRHHRWFVVGVVFGLLFAALSSPRRRRRRRRRRLSSALNGSACVAGTGWRDLAHVPRLATLQDINSDIPASIQTGPRDALVLLPKNQQGISSCEEVDVVVAQASPGRCLVVGETRYPAYRVTRHERFEEEWRPIARIREAKQRMPSDSTRKRARTLEVRLLAKLDAVLAELEPVVADAARFADPAYAATISSRGAVLVMCINAGNLDLLMNFVLSTECARIPARDNLVVFAADVDVRDALAAAGVRAFRHTALGDFRGDAARNYGDHQFVEMMWLKITCVFLVNHLGYDALFQDADLVWWRNPWPYFAARPDLDSFWMDDGARTSRFAPHFPNTGFYLIRANPRTNLFTTQLLGSYSTVLAWQSHQALVSQLLAEAHALYGLTLKILAKEEFPSGKQLHHNRPLFDKIHAKTFVPYCFHMCWTAGKADKLKFLKQEGLWPNECRPRRLDCAFRALGPSIVLVFRLRILGEDLHRSPRTQLCEVVVVVDVHRVLLPESGLES
ncbi:hypothetical protein CTAYLR_008616 [Chrysophaeum taylorii]|uniref:Nucleotide-diphospho-sugar transferase domain-containing protein n=1 Tax=Chrysophaeum taylorii TaxID=2483200 RepID=A0AAD7UKL9_9STRA|nr:hypothetical protein CTAYLR_008616 [Chrysophaeum taylorii]